MHRELAVAYPVGTVPIDPLYGPKLSGGDPACHGVTDGWRRRGSKVSHVDGRAREILCDLDLDVAQVASAGLALPLLLVGVVALGGAWGTAFHPAVPVMRDKWLALVPLSRAVGIDIIYMREVGLKARR